MQPKKWPGDSGKTRMVGVHEIEKDALAVEAAGTVDELNSFIGLSINKIRDSNVTDFLKDIQKDLFTIGAEIAGSSKRENKATKLVAEQVIRLEEMIHKLDNELKPLKNFILPGGSEDAAVLHVARSVCRRAERRVVSLKKEKIINDDIIKYLNRLSYMLFLLARRVNDEKGIEEHKW